MADEYLNGNVKDILEPMISALLIAQPEDPKFFMLHWLKNLYSLDYIVINKEKEELENLRLEVKGYNSKKNENKQNAEQPLEELKSKLYDKQNDNLIKSLKDENENANENNINNINNINIDNENENNNQSKNEDSKNEAKNENTKIDNNETKNDNENNDKKDLIDFSEESEN